jgi:hypothetical protein
MDHQSCACRSGAILALVLSGDIDKNGKIQVSLGVIGKFLFSVSVSLYGGSAFIEYYELSKYSHMAQGFVMLMFAVFGLLGIGILYQSIALMQGKPLSEVISEVKAAFISILSNGKGGKTMNTLDITQLQKAVGVKADGILGRNTLTAVFQNLVLILHELLN